MQKKYIQRLVNKFLHAISTYAKARGECSEFHLTGRPDSNIQPPWCVGDGVIQKVMAGITKYMISNLLVQPNIIKVQ